MAKLKTAEDMVYRPTERKTYGTLRSSTKTRNTEKSNLQYIDHIWAKNGVIYYKTVYGKQSHMNPDEAINLANQLNKDVIRLDKRPDTPWNMKDLKRTRDELVERLITATRRALKQRKEPETESDRLLSNAYHGLDRKGQKITAEKTFNEQVLQQAIKSYPNLKKDDIIAILKNPKISPTEADRILKSENSKRQIDYNQFVDKNGNYRGK